MVPNPIIFHYNAMSHTATAFPDLLRRWKWEIMEHPPYSPNMSLCDYNIFAKVKEPPREIRNNTRDELMRATGRLIRNINIDGCADDVRSIPHIRQKIIHKGDDYM